MIGKILPGYQNFILSKLWVAAPIGSDIAFSAKALASKKTKYSWKISKQILLTVHRILLHFLAGPKTVLLIVRFGFLFSIRPWRTLGKLVLKLWNIYVNSSIKLLYKKIVLPSLCIWLWHPWHRSLVCCTSLFSPSQSSWPQLPSISPERYCELR